MQCLQNTITWTYEWSNETTSVINTPPTNTSNARAAVCAFGTWSIDRIWDWDCNAGYEVSGTVCSQCTAGEYNDASVWRASCSTCPLEGGTAGTSAAGSDAITDCYKTYVSVANGHLSGTCYYSTGTSSYANMVTGICDLTCNPGYHVSGSSCVANTITISYNVNTGTGSAASTTCTYGGTCNLSTGGTMSKTGYTLTNWCTSGGTACYALGSSHPELATSNTSITLYAQWTANTIAISYDAGVGGTGTAPSTPLSFVYDAVATAPNNTNYTNTGYTFAGWECTISPGVYCSSTGNDIDPSTGIVLAGGSIKNAAASGGIKLTAQWAPDTFTITLDNNGGSGTPATTADCSGNTCTCTAGTPCTLPGSGLTPPSSTIPYSFDGWDSAYDGSGAAGVAYETDYGTSGYFSSSVIIHARWKKTIDFNNNYNPPASGTYATQTCYHNGNLALPTFPSAESSGFSAGGASWYQDNYGGTVAYDVLATAPINCDAATITPVYPKWVYQVIYNGNSNTGGSVPPPTICTKNEDCDLTDIPSMTRTGYTLDMDNWYSNGLGTGGTDYPDTGTINNPAGEITLFAKWTQCATGQWVNIVTNTCEDCPIGFYCPAGATSPTACPLGHTTSAINSTVITECYITAGTGGTLFCDDNGCFTLPNLGSPANNIIHYQN